MGGWHSEWVRQRKAWNWAGGLQRGRPPCLGCSEKLLNSGVGCRLYGRESLRDTGEGARDQLGQGTGCQACEEDGARTCPQEGRRPLSIPSQVHSLPYCVPAAPRNSPATPSHL